MRGIRHVFIAAAIGSILISCDLTAPDSEEVVMYVGPERVECTGFVEQLCYLVREDPSEDWTYFYEYIEGFEYQPGYIYKLLVSRRRIENPPQDASSLAYRLIRVLEMHAAPDASE